jgi:hypothetical protein
MIDDSQRRCDGCAECWQIEVTETADVSYWVLGMMHSMF